MVNRESGFRANSCCSKYPSSHSYTVLHFNNKLLAIKGTNDYQQFIEMNRLQFNKMPVFLIYFSSYWIVTNHCIVTVCLWGPIVLLSQNMKPWIDKRTIVKWIFNIVVNFFQNFNIEKSSKFNMSYCLFILIIYPYFRIMKYTLNLHFH